jgi:hypothetical protein
MTKKTWYRTRPPKVSTSTVNAFFKVDVWTGSQLTRFAVLFVMDLATRRVEIAGMGSSQPVPGWFSAVAR